MHLWHPPGYGLDTMAYHTCRSCVLLKIPTALAKISSNFLDNIKKISKINEQLKK